MAEGPEPIKEGKIAEHPPTGAPADMENVNVSVSADVTRQIVILQIGISKYYLSPDSAYKLAAGLAATGDRIEKHYKAKGNGKK
jgi:hypothetical protein